MFQISRKSLSSLAVLTTLAGFSGGALAADPWVVDANESEIEFTGTQLGAEFEGEFESFDATIVFSPDDLAGSAVEVVIDIASVNTQNADRDSQIVSADWFDAAQWPTAKFVTKSFREIAPGKYEAVADLTIRDVTREVTMPFDLEITGNEAEAEGKVTIKRTDFGVGQGQWIDTTQVGDAVTIKIEIEATR
ncbi:YceI family protein [Thalassospira australica]|uniref:YceI family protein n=1 Tax=Thalassospira australica TaxID=1528106 RepID=UPI00051A740B|nr:YceI family protein [Thalassospira australica]